MSAYYISFKFSLLKHSGKKIVDNFTDYEDRMYLLNIRLVPLYYLLLLYLDFRLLLNIFSLKSRVGLVFYTFYLIL